MSVIVERLPNEAILIATLEGDITVTMIQEMFRQSASLIRTNEKRVFRIANIVNANTNLIEIMKILQEASQENIPASTRDPRIKAILVGTTHWINFFRDAMAQERFGKIHLPAFDNMDDALEYARNSLKIQE